MKPIVRLTFTALSASLAFSAPPVVAGSSGLDSRSGAVQTIATGLANPRGIAIGQAGRILVAEAGKGGTPSTMTGHITEVFFGRTHRLLTLPSATVPTGEVGGPTNVVVGNGFGELFVTMGAGNGPPPFGSLLRSYWQRTSYVANIAAYEAANNPDGVQPPDSNPYGMAVVADGVLLTDAAANDLLHVARDGTIELVAVFPPAPNPLFPGIGGPTVQAVPTSVAVGPDGAWYVSELRGFPFASPSHIWRIEPGSRNIRCVLGSTSGPCVDWSSGLRHVVSIAFGPDGNLYASQYGPGPGPAFLPGWSTAGSVVRIDMTTKAVSTIFYGLEAPGGIAIDRDGDIYVSNRSTSSDSGEILRIKPIAYESCFK